MNVTRTGWGVTMAGTGINLALGILYSWSIIKGAIPSSWNWSNADKALPYAIACICFAAAMIPAGRLQDRFGPRLVATSGGILVGGGCLLAGLLGSSLPGFVLGFGVMAGVGIGFCYASTTPPAVKWFPPQKTGMIAGIVVAGFGLASVYIAPLATYLLQITGKEALNPATGQTVLEQGVPATMLISGVFFLAVIVILAQFLRNPRPEEVAARPVVPAENQVVSAKSDSSWRDMLATGQFYILWLMFFAGAAAGLTFISIAQDLGKQSLGNLAFLAVVVLAVGNAGGRVLGGTVSDRIGRPWTLFCIMLLQAVVLLVLYLVQHGAGWPAMMAIIILIGANYGANLALFPSAAKDFFGLKNFGLNYGLLFSAWGVAGFLMPWLNGRIKDLTGTNDLAYFLIIGMLMISAALTFVSRRLAGKAV